MGKVIYGVVCALAVLVFFPTTALAYAEPSGGSQVMQFMGVVIFAVIGLLIGFKSRLKAFFSRSGQGGRSARRTTGMAPRRFHNKHHIVRK